MLNIYELLSLTINLAILYITWLSHAGKQMMSACSYQGHIRFPTLSIYLKFCIVISRHAQM